MGRNAWILACLLIPSATPAQQPADTGRTAGMVNVRDYHAAADGKTDDTAAFQQALNDVGRAGGGTVTVPAGSYMLQGHLSVPDGVTLEGVLRMPAATPCGTILLTTAGKGEENGEPFITLHRSSGVKGLVISYPEQSREKPVPYPWCIRGVGDNCTLLDLLLVNPWQAVDFGTRDCGRHLIRGLYAQAIRRGIYVDRCYDVGRIEDVHLWPFWTVSDPKGPWMAVSKEQGEGFIFGRSDWEYVTNCFAIGYQIGMHFIRSNDAKAGGGNYLLTQSGSDISQTAVMVDEAQSHSGISFSNSQLYGDVIVKPANTGMVRFTGCGFFGSMNGKQGTAQFRLAGSGRVSFDNCSFHCIDPGNRGRYLFVVESGRLGIVGCQFVTSEFTAVNPVPISLGENVVSAVIVGNEFNGRMQIVNHARGTVRVADNVSDTAAAYARIVEKRDQIPLRKIVPGSETADLVPNGDFEQHDAAGRPSGWMVAGDIGTGPCVAPLPAGWKGKTVLVCRPGAHRLPNSTITRKIHLKPNAEYVLSGYIWSFPRAGQTVMANIDVGLETPGEMRLAVGPGLSGVAGGYFVYGRFSTARTGTDVTVRAFYDGPTKFSDPRLIGAQWDRIAVTEASKFRPPTSR